MGWVNQLKKKKKRMQFGLFLEQQVKQFLESSIHNKLLVSKNMMLFM